MWKVDFLQGCSGFMAEKRGKYSDRKKRNIILSRHIIVYVPAFAGITIGYFEKAGRKNIV